ncbi:hypothetical protein WCX72_11495 [Sulfurimonas sp. HSL1-6]|uniref:hypothetical protein n=1 Tax=Thiomicrolovo immobilis TaxID=3131935 RepID=UPI0031F7D561
MTISRLTMWLLPIVAGVLLGGCVMKKPPVTAAYVVVFKTPQWRFADTGYIRKGDGVAELEVFEAGQRILRLQIESLVCMEGEGCLAKSAFNAKYLSAAYPDDLFYHLLRGEAIMERRNIVHTDEGFEQQVGGIVYRVTAEQIYFRDLEHGILIKFKRLQ